MSWAGGWEGVSFTVKYILHFDCVVMYVCCYSGGRVYGHRHRNSLCELLFETWIKLNMDEDGGLLCELENSFLGWSDLNSLLLS